MRQETTSVKYEVKTGVTYNGEFYRPEQVIEAVKVDFYAYDTEEEAFLAAGMRPEDFKLLNTYVKVRAIAAAKAALHDAPPEVLAARAERKLVAAAKKARKSIRKELSGLTPEQILKIKALLAGG